MLLEARRRMRNRPWLVLIGASSADTPRITDPGIVIARAVPSAQVMASWMRASIAVVPSTWNEPLAQVAIEAMLVGRAVVASDVGGLRDLIEHRATGLMVPPGDPASLAAALDSLLDDPEMGSKWAKRDGYARSSTRSAAVAPRVVEVFEDTLRRRSRRSREISASTMWARPSVRGMVGV